MEQGPRVPTPRLPTITLAAVLLLVMMVVGPAASARTAPLIVDHTSADLTPIPASAIADAKANLHVAYGHTSHGSQVMFGMYGLTTFAGAPLPPATYAVNEGGGGGALDLDDYFAEGDLGNPDFTSWASKTRTYLDQSPHSDVNVIMWSWCRQVSEASEADIATYLSLMNGLERDYPSVTFVYMTGRLDGTGLTGNLNLRNEQIRAWCRANNRVLYDFADIESYDPDGTGYLAAGADDGCNYNRGNWAKEWQASHTVGEDWYICNPRHTEDLNGNLKAYAAWHLFARLAGWDPGTSVQQPPIVTVPSMTILPVSVTPVVTATPTSSTFIFGKQYAVGNPSSLIGTRFGSAGTPIVTTGPRTAITPTESLNPGSRAYGISPPTGLFVRWYPAARWEIGNR